MHVFLKIAEPCKRETSKHWRSGGSLLIDGLVLIRSAEVAMAGSRELCGFQETKFGNPAMFLEV